MKKLFVLAAALCVSSGAFAQALFIEGTHYQPVTPHQPTSDPSKVEVVEVFSYACGHCANFQPFVHPWAEALPEHAKFQRLPVVFGRRAWEPFARAYYALEAMGRTEGAHDALFDAIHKERAGLRTIEQIASHLNQRVGIDEKEFLRVAKSFAVETRLKRGQNMVRRYGVDATPSMVINGKYRVTAAMAGSIPRMFEILDYLIEREAANLPQPEPEVSAEAVSSP